MTKRELRELIKSVIKEYGTGAGGRNHPKGGGNLQTSPRPFVDEKDELENYTDKGAPFGGAEGQHTRGMEKNKGSFNRTRFTKF